MNLFYSPHIQGDILELDEQESKHTVRVLRLRKGDRINLVNGTGGWYEALIEDDHPRRCRLKVLSCIPDYRPLPYDLHIAISPTKSADRFEWFVEKATEIGISEITPLISSRTERNRFNAARMERILVSAMKQSLRAYKPVLNEPLAIDDFIAVERPGTKGIAHCIHSGREGAGGRESTPEGGSIPGESGAARHGDPPRRGSAPGQRSVPARAGLPERTGLTDLPRNAAYTLMVGPEGDFTEEEVSMALDAGYIPFHLGDSRLRTETAGVYICAAISLLS